MDFLFPLDTCPGDGDGMGGGLNIFVLGARDAEGKYGGVEVYCKDIYPLYGIKIMQPKQNILFCSTVHVHGLRKAWVIPFLKLSGKRVYYFCHSFNYRHNKWSKPAKLFMRVSEYFAFHCADRVICVADWMKTYLEVKYVNDIPRVVSTPCP